VSGERSGATSSGVLDVPVEAVAMVLADPRLYDGVVVGSRRIRWFDPRWPEPGTRFDHTIGFGPVTIRDHSDVVENDLPRLLRLAVHLRPLGSAEVTFRLTPDGTGTRVDIVEVPTSGVLAATWSPPAVALTRWRNDRVLHRLEKLAGDRARTAGLA
jgi:Polyketide cyclase / dehydrase and lipid transport